MEIAERCEKLTNIDDKGLADVALIIPLSIGSVKNFDDYLRKSLIGPFENSSDFVLEKSNPSHPFMNLKNELEEHKENCKSCKDYITLLEDFNGKVESGYNSFKSLFEEYKIYLKEVYSEKTRLENLISNCNIKTNKTNKAKAIAIIKQSPNSQSKNNELLQCANSLVSIISDFMQIEKNKKGIQTAIDNFSGIEQIVKKLTDKEKINNLTKEIIDNNINELLKNNVAFMRGVESFMKENLPLAEALISDKEKLSVLLASSLAERGLIDKGAKIVLNHAERSLIPVENLLDNLDHTSYGMMSLVIFGFSDGIDNILNKATSKVIEELKKNKVPVLSFGRVSCNAMEERGKEISRYRLIPRLYTAIIKSMETNEFDNYLKVLLAEQRQEPSTEQGTLKNQKHETPQLYAAMIEPTESAGYLQLAVSGPNASHGEETSKGDDFKDTHFEEYVVADLVARQAYAAKYPDRPINEVLISDIASKIGEEITEETKKGHDIDNALSKIAGTTKPHLFFVNLNNNIETKYTSTYKYEYKSDEESYKLHEEQIKALKEIYENLKGQLEALQKHTDNQDELHGQQIEALKKISDTLKEQLEKLQEQGKQHEQQNESLNKIYDSLKTIHSVKPESSFYNLCKEMTGSARCIPIDNDTFIIDIEQPFDTGKWEDEKIKGLLKKVKDEIKEIKTNLSAEVYGYASELDKVLTCNQLQLPEDFSGLTISGKKLKVEIGKQYEFTCRDEKGSYNNFEGSPNDTLSLMRAAWVADQIKDSFEISKIDYKGASFASEGDSHFDRRVRIIFKTEEKRLTQNERR